VKSLYSPPALHVASYATALHIVIDPINQQFAVAMVVGMFGPRQTGKTTLARQIAASGILPFNPDLNYFDLEIKYTDAPRVTASQRTALEHLQLEKLPIVCPGNASYPLAEKIEVTGLARLAGSDAG
jgi:hypothetical protein